MSQAFTRLATLLAAAFLFVLPAAAADLTYTVSGIHVDASAASASAAQAIAIDQGRPKAWNILYRRLAKQADWAKEPKLDSEGLHRLSRGFTVANERRSTTRYVADVTYMFSPVMVAKALATVSSSYGMNGSARRILLIPMSPNFDRSSLWTGAFSSPRFAQSAVPFVVPTGDAQDVRDLGHLQFDATNWPDVQLVAARIHATEAVLVLAIPITKGGTSKADPMTGQVQVWLKRIGVTEAPTKTSVNVPLIRNPAQTYPLAADAAVHAIEVMYQQKPAIEFGARSSLTADVRVDSLSQWATIQNSFGLVQNVVSVNVVAMDIGLVRISMTYQGSTEQLAAALAPVGVAMTKDSNGWAMAYATPPRPTASADQ
ncbi:MAG TPA: hypothetical protein VG387_09030 [Rhizomicrobium sp.]|jgi:hypothetical protein|nr:hypothetical protein [Rhizomicrobium sp.]